MRASKDNDDTARSPSTPASRHTAVGRESADDVQHDIGSADSGVRGVFADPAKVTRAVRRLAEHSVPMDEIHVFAMDGAGGRGREVRVKDQPRTLKNALIGAGVGAAVGVVVTAVVPTGAFGSTDVLGFSGLWGTLRGIAILAAAGVPAGVLLGMGPWATRKAISEDDLSDGGACVVVDTEELADVAHEVLEGAGAERVTR